MDTTSSTSSRQTVAIFGAGIAGLSAAQELIEMGFNVTIYECDDVAGGFAKSGRTDDGMPTEYSWRGFGPWYNNVYEMMKRIPSPNHGPLHHDLPQEPDVDAIEEAAVMETPTMEAIPTMEATTTTVFDTELSKPIKFLIARNHCTAQPCKELVLSSFTPFDRISFALITARVLVANRRSHEQYSSIDAAEYFSQRLSHNAAVAVVSSFGPWIGTDAQRTSLHHAGAFHLKNMYSGKPHIHPGNKTNGGQSWKHGGRDGWLLLRGPSNESWFNPWVKHLSNLGVQFRFGTKVTRFEGEIVNGGTKIAYAELADVQIPEKLEQIKADHYIVAITPFACKDVFAASSNMIQSDSEIAKFPSLIADGPHIQISFRIGFGEKIIIGGQQQAIILTDSEI